MEAMTCPTCGNSIWTIYGDLFETGGTYLILTAECVGCQHRLNLGVVDGQDIR